MEQPIFKETEKNGIYTATLFSIVNGTVFENKLEMDLRSIRESDIQRVLKSNPDLDLNSISLIVNTSLEKNRKNYIADLYKEHLKRIEYEKINTKS